MVIFHSYVSLPEGTHDESTKNPFQPPQKNPSLPGSARLTAAVKWFCSTARCNAVRPHLGLQKKGTHCETFDIRDYPMDYPMDSKYIMKHYEKRLSIFTYVSLIILWIVNPLWNIMKHYETNGDWSGKKSLPFIPWNRQKHLRNG